MSATLLGVGARPPSHVIGHKLDSIPFSAYHIVIIPVLGFVGFIEGDDLVLTGSLLVLAKGPLHLSPDEVRALATWPTFLMQLIAVAVAHVTQCPYCIRGHTRAALRHGATPQELMEAIWVAAEMRAGGAYAHTAVSLTAIEEETKSGSAQGRR